MHKLSRPFPEREGVWESLRTISVIGLFVAMFLFIVRPFGLAGSWRGLLPVCLGFGLVTVVFGFVFDLLVRYVLRLRTDGPGWTLGKWIVLCIALVVWIGLGNYLYMNMLSGRIWSGHIDLLYMLGYTAVIGFFPVLFSGLLVQMKAERQHEQEAIGLHPRTATVRSEAKQPITLNALNGRDFTVHAEDVRFVEAMQNYITVYHLHQGRIQKEVLRSTMAATEEQFAGSPVLRCHRSYLVNADSITMVNGNAQGLRLQLQDVEGQEVPVSRPYIPKLRMLLG